MKKLIRVLKKMKTNLHISLICTCTPTCYVIYLQKFMLLILDLKTTSVAKEAHFSENCEYIKKH